MNTPILYSHLGERLSSVGCARSTRSACANVNVNDAFQDGDTQGVVLFVLVKKEITYLWNQENLSYRYLNVGTKPGRCSFLDPADGRERVSSIPEIVAICLKLPNLLLTIMQMPNPCALSTCAMHSIYKKNYEFHGK